MLTVLTFCGMRVPCRDKGGTTTTNGCFLSASLLLLLSSLPTLFFFWKSWWYVAHASDKGDRRATLPPRNLEQKSRPYRFRFICAGLARAGKSARRSHEPVALLLRILKLQYASPSRFHCIVGAGRALLPSTVFRFDLQNLGRSGIEALFQRTSSTDRESGNIFAFCPCTRKGVETRAPRDLLPSRWSGSAPQLQLPIGVGNYRMEVCCTGVRWVRAPPCIFWRNPTHNVMYAAAATRSWNRLDCLSISLAITLSFLLPTLRVARIRYNWFHRYCR